MTLHPPTPPQTSTAQSSRLDTTESLAGLSTPPGGDTLVGEPLHVALVGMPCAGKTSVARLVAERLGYECVDVDEVIAEAAGKPISTIFSEQGETMFRAHERRHVRALLRRERPMVLACGGGTWADAAMRRELLTSTRPVFLEASFDALLERLETSNERHLRPLLAGPDPKAALERLWRARNDVHALCPRQVSSMNRTVSEVADAVVARLNTAMDAERLERAQNDLQALSSSVAVAAGQRREQQAQGGRARERPNQAGGKTYRGTAQSRASTPQARAQHPEAAPVETTTPQVAPPLPQATPDARELTTSVAAPISAQPSVPAPKHEDVPAPPVSSPRADVAQTSSTTTETTDGHHDDAFGTFLQQDIEAFAVPLSTLSHESSSQASAPSVSKTADAESWPAEEGQTTLAEESCTPFLRVGGRLGDYPIYVLDTDATGDASEARAAEAVAEQIDAHSHGTRIAIVSDTEVAARHAPALREALRARGLAVSVHTFAAGEESKRLSTAHGLYDELADAGHGREDTLVALGGGVVTDLTGFVASTYMRGVPLVQVPTSTLAAVDACIGGKTGLNTNRGKNLVGTFFAPQAVVISTAYLRTQSHRAHVAGLVEAAKVAALQDADLLLSMKNNARILAAGDPTVLREVIGKALVYKARIVERDEQERGERALLNYGHTFGHAIEVGEGFGRLHGEAVALGMLAEAEWAEMHGQATNVSKPLAEVLEALGIPTEWRAARVDLDALGRDKKRMGDTLKLPVVSALGQAHLTAVALDDLIDFAQATMLPSVRWSR